jgi:hypothetical protein
MGDIVRLVLVKLALFCGLHFAMIGTALALAGL